MKINYKPQSELEKFGRKIYFLLVENFPSTYYVGGAVRDMLLGRKITDIDVATSATPEQIKELLASKDVKLDSSFMTFGVVKAVEGNKVIEITAYRKDLTGKSRYPKVEFTKSYATDSQRRDFSINSLYLSLKSGKILDPQGGLPDLKKGIIKFIGEPNKRIKEDPLRIARAIRFSLELNFTIEQKSKKALHKNFYLLKSLSKNKLQSEIEKVKNIKLQKTFHKMLSSNKYLT